MRHVTARRTDSGRMPGIKLLAPISTHPQDDIVPIPIPMPYWIPIRSPVGLLYLLTTRIPSNGKHVCVLVLIMQFVAANPSSSKNWHGSNISSTAATPTAQQQHTQQELGHKLKDLKRITLGFYYMSIQIKILIKVSIKIDMILYFKERSLINYCINRDKKVKILYIGKLYYIL